MFQNFKTDIIYYNTNADFELEFNLCGCCRMRLLNDKCADKKTLLASLSRAFSRSRVIILTAPLFDGSNIIKTVSAAIGKSVEKIDLNSYNINSSVDIEITKSSIPLVTADGIFGGCIIESGPQTLIMITDNKSVRKTIMKDLIHPYIEELASGEAHASEPEDVQDTEEIITEVLPETEEETIAEPTDNLGDMLITQEDGSLEEDLTEEYYESEGLITDTDTEPEDETDEYYYTENTELYTETKNDIKSNSDSESEAEDDDGYYDEYYIDDPKPQTNSTFNISLIVISAILLLAIAVLCFCIFFVPSRSGTTPAVYLQEIFNTMFK